MGGGGGQGSWAGPSCDLGFRPFRLGLGGGEGGGWGVGAGGPGPGRFGFGSEGNQGGGVGGGKGFCSKKYGFLIIPDITSQSQI